MKGRVVLRISSGLLIFLLFSVVLIKLLKMDGSHINYFIPEVKRYVADPPTPIVPIPATNPTSSDNIPDLRCVILYLIKPSEEDNLIYSLRLLVVNFQQFHNYPVILLHDPNYEASALLSLKQRITTEITDNFPKQLGLQILFHQLEWHLPASYDPKANPPQVWASAFPGYQLMIHFWFKDIFELPLLRNTRYYMRLDTDSFILSEIREDPFKVMEENKFSYAYRYISTDIADVTAGLINFVDEYVNSTEKRKFVDPDRLARNGLYLPPAGPERNGYGPPIIYNNFEMVDMERFRRPDMRDFIQAVEDTQNIFVYRWGDAPLRYYQLMVLLDWKKEVWDFCFFKYEHKHHGKTIDPCI